MHKMTIAQCTGTVQSTLPKSNSHNVGGVTKICNSIFGENYCLI